MRLSECARSSFSQPFCKLLLMGKASNRVLDKDCSALFNCDVKRRWFVGVRERVMWSWENVGLLIEQVGEEESRLSCSAQGTWN